MEAQELRIRNYLHDAKGKLAIVEGLSKDNIKAYSGMVTPLPLKPIPLTEEWLLKWPNDLIIPSWIEFVHELQNWYWVKNKFKKELF